MDNFIIILSISRINTLSAWFKRPTIYHVGSQWRAKSWSRRLIWTRWWWTVRCIWYIIWWIFICCWIHNSDSIRISICTWRIRSILFFFLERDENLYWKLFSNFLFLWKNKIPKRTQFSLVNFSFKISRSTNLCFVSNEVNFGLGRYSCGWFRKNKIGRRIWFLN